MRAVRRATLVLLISLALVAPAATAVADTGGGTSKAGDFVRQAIALIVNEPGTPMAAEERINDALNAPDKTGVDMALVEEAAAVIGRGDIHQARALLERSIGARPHLGSVEPVPIGQSPPLATGAETGINVVTDPLAPHRGMTGGDWAALSGLIALGALGLLLAVRFRPRFREHQHARAPS